MTTIIYKFRLHFLPALLLIILTSARMGAQTNQWESVGPYLGTAYSFAIGNGVVSALTNGNGVFSSESAGSRWTQAPYSFSGPRFLLARDSIVLAIGSSIDRSTDRGATWSPVGIPARYYAGCYMGDTVFAASYYGDIYRSVDDGAEWSLVARAPGVGATMLSAGGSTLYYGSAIGLYRSRDGGATWDPLWGGNAVRNIRGFAAHDSLLVISLGSDTGGIADQVYRSRDGGETWSPVFAGITSMYFGPITWDRGEFLASCRYYGGVFRSSKGVTWTKLETLPPTEINAVCASGDTMFVGSDDGIFRSFDRGETWRQFNDGYTNADVPGITSLNGDLYAAVADGGVYRSSDNGSTWSPTTPTSWFRDAMCVAASYDAVVVGMDYWGSDVGGGIFRSTDRGASWLRTEFQLGRISKIAVSGNLMAAAAEDKSFIGVVSLSTDGGLTWSQTAAKYPFESIGDIRFVGNALVVGTDTGVYRSTDNGRTWTPKNNGITTGRWVSHISAIGQGYNVLLAGTVSYADNVAIYRSTDDGDTWTPAYPSSQNTAVTAFTSYGSTIFASVLNRGVLRSTDNGATWQRFNNGLFNASLEALLYDNGTLYAGSASGGIMRTSSALGVEQERAQSASSAPAAYPNPCTGSATIRYRVPNGEDASQRVCITLFDAMGREAARPLDARQRPGTYDAVVDVAGLASGTYFYELRTGTAREWGSLVVIGR